MQLKRVEIIKYRNFKNIVIDFEKSDFPNVFSIASKNGVGKSTLLQFIFIILHCFMDENKKEYIQNILQIFSNTLEDFEFVKFMIEDDKKVYYLNFSISKDSSFNLYLDKEQLKQEIDINREKEQKINQIVALKELLNEFNRLTPLFKNKFRDAEDIFNELGMSAVYDRLRIENNQDKIVDDYKKIIDKALKDSMLISLNIESLQKDYKVIENSLNEFHNQLDSENIIYISHINNQTVLILKTDMNHGLLKKLSNKVFLTAPSSQIYHFLNSNDKKEIFDSIVSYSVVLQNAKNRLTNFSTYDFIPTELILKSFKKAFNEDLKIKRKTKEYGDKYDSLSYDLKNLLDEKEVIESEDGKRVIFKSKEKGTELPPEDLSHGELKKLGIYIWLKYIVEEDSIVLMDEVDIALHPKWQYELIKDLTTWSKGSQFLLATHSPQILSSTYYKNIIKLESGGVKRYSKPPLDRDINTIITEIMEAEDFPIELLILHKDYRKLINEGKVETEGAKKLKDKILEYESENSSFFQEINFDLELLM